MKTAMHESQLLNLESLSRESFQFIYEEGRKGNLTCPVCGESVRLFLGIQKEPHFFHILSKNSSCKDSLHSHEIKTVEEQESVQLGGFRIPKSRAIGTETAKPIEFKKARGVKKAPPFVAPNEDEVEHTIPFLQLLSTQGVSLDIHQREAVSHTEGPLLVIAGAGSGKTRVLTTRTAYMLHEKGMDPRSIMLVTFTAKAAAEMKGRLLTYPGIQRSSVQQLVSGTFHSIFYRILAFHTPETWNSQKLIKKDWQKEQIVKAAGRELELDEKEFSYDLALQQIGFWKNSLILPHQVKPETKWDEKTAFLYQYYEEYKQTNDLFDFDDMLIGCYKFFHENPEILEQYQSRFQYFLIDEFQDINKVQYELIKLLSERSKNVCAVGDDDQSIYAFRGSDPQYLLQFEKDFPDSKLVVLDQNYRSSHEIVTTANSVIKGNKIRRAKNMHGQFSSEQDPLLFFPYDEEEEATMILTDMQDKIAGGFKPEDFCILFRTNTGSRAIFERLANSSLPFKIDQDIEPFYERFMVKSMLSFLRLSIDEENQTAIKYILPTLFVKQSILNDIRAKSILEDRTLLECLSEVKTGFAFQERKLKKLLPIIRSLSSLSPLTAIEEVEKELGYQDFVKKRGNEGNQLDKGSDDIRDLKVAAKRFHTIKEFLEHVDHMTAMNREIKRMSKDKTDSITLSTIHRAKGLEYKVVYLVGVVDGSLPHDFALEANRNGDESELEEERRLLYVAITRAQELLYISIPTKRRGKKAYPSRFLKALR